MNDGYVGFGIFLGLILMCITNLILPVEDGVVPRNYERAAAACVQHGGLTKVYRPTYIGQTTHVLCTNKVELDLPAEQAD